MSSSILTRWLFDVSHQRNRKCSVSLLDRSRHIQYIYGENFEPALVFGGISSSALAARSLGTCYKHLRRKKSESAPPIGKVTYLSSPESHASRLFMFDPPLNLVFFLSHLSSQWYVIHFLKIVMRKHMTSVLILYVMCIITQAVGAILSSALIAIFVEENI